MERGGYEDLETPGRTSAARYLAGYRSWPQMLVRLLVSLVLLVVLDLVWIKLLAPLLGLDYFGVVEAIQGASLAWRPLGLLAYLSLGYALAAMTENWADGTRLGYIIYSIFDFTSTFMYHRWTLKFALLDTAWGTLLFTIIAAVLKELSRVPQYQRLD